MALHGMKNGSCTSTQSFVSWLDRKQFGLYLWLTSRFKHVKLKLQREVAALKLIRFRFRAQLRGNNANVFT